MTGKPVAQHCCGSRHALWPILESLREWQFDTHMSRRCACFEVRATPQSVPTSSRRVSLTTRYGPAVSAAACSGSCSRTRSAICGCRRTATHRHGWSARPSPTDQFHPGFSHAHSKLPPADARDGETDAVLYHRIRPPARRRRLWSLILPRAPRRRKCGLERGRVITGGGRIGPVHAS